MNNVVRFISDVEKIIDNTHKTLPKDACEEKTETAHYD